MTIIIITWVGCGLLNYMMMYAYFSKKWQYLYEPRTQHIITAFLGPITLLAGIFYLINNNGLKNTFKYGLKL